MAVLLEAANVVVRLAAVRSRLEGGWDGLRGLVVNRTFCADEHLARVGFMDESDGRKLVLQLEERGLVFVEDGVSRDIAGVSDGELWVPAPWLEIGSATVDGEEVSVGWLAGEERGEIELPENWQPGRRLSHFTPEQATRRLVFLGTSDAVDVYLDRETGEKTYVGRTDTEGQSELMNHRLQSIDQEARELADTFAGLARAGDGDGAKAVLTKIQHELEPEARRIVADPRYVDLGYAHYVHGLTLRGLRRWDLAEQAYRRANERLPGQMAILLEWVMCLGRQNRNAEALPLAEEAVRIDPTNTNALGNLASCLLFTGDVEGAEKAIDRAIELKPEDPLNQRIQAAVRKKTKRKKWWWPF